MPNERNGDLNSVRVSGEITDRIRYGETRKGVSCCSFWLNCWEDTARSFASVRVKVNVYGSLVHESKRELSKGALVTIEGKLMNRREKGSEPRMEVRATHLSFPLWGQPNV